MGAPTMVWTDRFGPRSDRSYRIKSSRSIDDE
jgi:hypothetical protein